MATRRGYNRYMQDADLKVTRVLGNGAGTVTSTGIDCQAKGADSVNPPYIEALVVVPDFNTTQLPDTRTVTATIEASDDSAFGSGVDTLATLVFTGAGGVGSVGGELRVGVGSNTKRYLRVKFVNGASVGDCTDLTATFGLVF